MKRYINLLFLSVLALSLCGLEALNGQVENNKNLQMDATFKPAGAGNDVDQVDREWKLLVKQSRESSADQDKIWDAMVKMLDYSSRRVSQLAKDPTYNVRPVKNVDVDGLPISGMRVEDVKDPEIKAKYQSEIKENAKRISNFNYRIQWYQLYTTMNSNAKDYITLHDKDKKSSAKRLSLLEKFNAIGSVALQQN